MMESTALRRALAEPTLTRAALLEGFEHTVDPLPDSGSSFFVHPSELCPVACQHCMYASTMDAKSDQSSLSDLDARRVVEFINSSRSQKLNISGGGEPFLRFSVIEKLVSSVDVPRIEIVTAGYWAKSQRRAAELISLVDAARQRNPHRPDVLLRLSIDSYHINAPRPVKLEHYANAVNAWRSLGTGIRFGLRSIQPDLDIVDQQLATTLGGTVEELDRWNRAIVVGADRIPITFNVFRESGAAEDLPAEERARMRKASMTMEDYYSPFETSEHRLSLATAINDAIRGSYSPDDGLAVTLNSDMRFWIFTGTSPDRYLRLQDQSFADAVAYFFADPITHLLVNEGIWTLADIVAELDPQRQAAAMAKNDTASLVDDLLGDPSTLAAVTLIAIHRMRTAGLGDLGAGHPLRELLETDDMLADCREALEVSR